MVALLIGKYTGVENPDVDTKEHLRYHVQYVVRVIFQLRVSEVVRHTIERPDEGKAQEKGDFIPIAVVVQAVNGDEEQHHGKKDKSDDAPHHLIDALSLTQVAGRQHSRIEQQDNEVDVDWYRCLKEHKQN